MSEEIVQQDAEAEMPETENLANDEEQTATPEQPEAEKPQRRNRAEERINALTKEKYDAQRQAEAARQQLAEMQIAMQQQTPAEMGDMPKLADYEFDESRYQQAMQQWSLQQRQQWDQQQAKQQQEWAAQQREMQRAAILQTKIAEGIKKYPDFQAKVFDPNLPRLQEISPAAFEAVLDSELAPDVAYHLASNPAEVYEFASLSPIQAIRKVAQIEAKFAKQATAQVPPPPPSRVSGNSEAAVDPQKMSTAEWMAWRNRQTSKR